MECIATRPIATPPFSKQSFATCLGCWRWMIKNLWNPSCALMKQTTLVHQFDRLKSFLSRFPCKMQQQSAESTAIRTIAVRHFRRQRAAQKTWRKLVEKSIILLQMAPIFGNTVLWPLRKWRQVSWIKLRSRASGEKVFAYRTESVAVSCGIGLRSCCGIVRYRTLRVNVNNCIIISILTGIFVWNFSKTFMVCYNIIMCAKFL